MNTLALLLATAVATSAPECLPTQEAKKILQLTNEPPTPHGMIIGYGSDWSAKFLVKRTTHRLPVFGVPSKEGTETTTYVASSQQRTCWKKIEANTCSVLESTISTLKVRSYSVMYKRDGLTKSGADHPSFALLHAQDGDGNVTKLISTDSIHPLMGDISKAFSDLKQCTRDVDEAAGGL